MTKVDPLARAITRRRRLVQRAFRHYRLTANSAGNRRRWQARNGESKTAVTDKAPAKSGRNDGGVEPKPAGDSDRSSIGAAERRGQADLQGWVSLFNGKDLAGWKTHPSQPGNWRVESGIMIGSGPHLSHLYTERGDYRDFRLLVEARINDGGTSGVLFRSHFGPDRPDRPFQVFGYEAQINVTHRDPNKTGSLYGMPGGALVALRESPVPPRQWFILEVVAQGSHIVISVNGKTTVDYTDEKRLYSSGYIALQQHDPSTVAEFRKIEITELSGTR